MGFARRLHIVPLALRRHLGSEFDITAPEVASLRAMYTRDRTLFDHQQVTCTVLDFRRMSEHQHHSLLCELRDEVARYADHDQLLAGPPPMSVQDQLTIVHERAIRTLIATTLIQLKAETDAAISANVDPELLDRWQAAVG